MSYEFTSARLLQKAITAFTMNQNFHISIQDMSGILSTNNPPLYLPHKYRAHESSFCQNAKTSAAGLRFCLRCKNASIKKSMQKKETYVGQCYLGITEIIRPVIVNDKVLCIIYLSNLYPSKNKSMVAQRIKRICNITGVDSKPLLDSLSSTQEIGEGDILIYTGILDVLENIIKSFLPVNVEQKNSEKVFPIFCPTNNWVIEAIQNHIMQFYNKDLNLSKLASQFFLNPDYLCRLFRKETGKNLSEYINMIRIEQAKQLLELTNTDIMGISHQVGFKNVTYFNRVFKKIAGCSPKEYRRLHSK